MLLIVDQSHLVEASDEEKAILRKRRKKETSTKCGTTMRCMSAAPDCIPTNGPQRRHLLEDLHAQGVLCLQPVEARHKLAVNLTTK